MLPTITPTPVPAALALAESLAQTRTSPGILVFTSSLQLLYMNHEARELSGRMNRAGNGHAALGVLSPEVTGLCDEIVAALRLHPDPKDWERVQLRRVTGDPQCPVLIRGVGIPGAGGLEEARLVILLEEIGSRKEVTAEGAKERFHLTDREQTVIIYLLKGLTNKEIARRVQVSEQTVKEHFKHIMRKTKASTRTGILAHILLGTCQPRREDRAPVVGGHGAGAS